MNDEINELKARVSELEARLNNLIPTCRLCDKKAEFDGYCWDCENEQQRNLKYCKWEYESDIGGV